MGIKKDVLFVLLLVVGWVSGQDRKSKADDHFFSYAYQDAITSYEKDLADGIGLSARQYRNLADSYFKQERFDKATEIYLQLFAKDSLVTDFYLNRLLQGLEKTSSQDSVRAFLEEEDLVFSAELMENSDFNIALLHSGEDVSELDFQIFNLQSNSPQSDFSPAFYGSKLLFTSGRTVGERKNYLPSGEAYLDIFEGAIGPNGDISNVNPFAQIATSEYHKATPYFSDQLNSVFYVLSNTSEGELEFDETGKNALGVGMQQLGGSFRMVWKDLSTSFYYPFYEQQSGKLYFAANLEGGYGGTDLYFVYTNNGQVMSAPKNLGPRVNSPGNEIAPYFFEGTLYFASDVFYGLGGMDIYRTNLSGEESFSIPVNLGRQINSAADDFGFVIKNEGKGLLGYFSSNRAGGAGGDDIYGFLVEEKPGLKTLVFEGQVINSTMNTGVEGATVKLLNLDGALIKEVLSNAVGKYRIEIPWQEEVIVETTKERYSLYSQQFKGVAIEQMAGAQNIPIVAYEDLVEEKEGQTVIKLKRMSFAKGKSTITETIAVELEKVVDAVRAFPGMQLRIETHTDSRGGSAYNFRLTQARSDAIKQYLISKGVPSRNILYAVGYGEDKILNNCTNGVFCLEMLHRQNQRSLIVVLNDNILFE
ncbi:MAG: OmpA family protein [Bacteroidota bacterium]